MQKLQDLAHPLFLTLDLVSEIVEGVAHTDDKHRTLYALARVSKTFSELALDLLWHDLKTWKHLLALLPDDAHREETVEVILACPNSFGQENPPKKHFKKRRVCKPVSFLARVSAHKYYIDPSPAVSRI